MLNRAIIMGLFVFLGSNTAIAQPVTGFCIQNASTETALFVVDAGSMGRQAQQLAPNMHLCTPEFEAPASGFVSIFLSEDALEGCSRLAVAGDIHVLLEYHDFDRCRWQTTP